MKNLNLFTGGGSIKPQAMQAPIEALADSLQAAIAGQGGQFVDSGVVAAAVSLESFGADTQMQLTTAVQNLRATVSAAVAAVASQFKAGDFNKNLTLAQESAAVASGIVASSPKAALRAPLHGLSKLKAMVGDDQFTSVIGHGSMQGTLDTRPQNLSMEAYDEKENRNAVAYSVAYNMQAARQDEFGEAFFPTIVVTPDNVGFMVSIRLHYVQEEVRRTLTGSLNNFGRKNIIKAVVDHTILRNDQTRLTPVVRSGGGANDSTANFVAADDVAPYEVTIDQHKVMTAPLKVGKRFDLIGLSQTDALISAGVLDQTDAIDSSLRLGAIYVKLGTAGGNAVIKFNTKDLAGSDFNYSVQGNTRQLQLGFNTNALLVTKNTVAVDGSSISQLAALTDSAVRLGADLFGSVVQDRGETSINTSDVTVSTVTDSTGQILSITAGAGKTVADIFADAKVIGYDLMGHRTNSNRRQRGQLVDTQFINNLYTVPLLAPITALRPVGDAEVNDSSLLASLITTTKIRTSNSAVGSLLEARDLLKDYINAADATLNQPEVLGVARYVVNAQYLEAVIDVPAQIDSLKSSDRAEDLQALLINKVRDMAFRLYTGSAYKAAADAIFDGASPKPLVIIGTDPILYRYLTISGDTRLLGDAFDFKIVQTLDARMRGKMIMSFGMESAYNSGVPNPLHFGAMAWKPEMTLMMPITRNGAISFELTVSPSYRHIVNLPIMGYITVTGIQEVIAGKVAVNSQVV